MHNITTYMSLGQVFPASFLKELQLIIIDKYCEI